jgi:hypothetical protein
MVYVQTCTVFDCPTAAEQIWCSHAGDRQWVVEWLVCPDHLVRLEAGEAWAPDYQTAPTWRRWIVMGSDLVQEVTPAERWRLDDQRRPRQAFDVIAAPPPALAP